jgi:hypothetical protein
VALGRVVDTLLATARLLLYYFACSREIPLCFSGFTATYQFPSLVLRRILVVQHGGSLPSPWYPNSHVLGPRFLPACLRQSSFHRVGLGLLFLLYYAVGALYWGTWSVDIQDTSPFLDAFSSLGSA